MGVDHIEQIDTCRDDDREVAIASIAVFEIFEVVSRISTAELVGGIN